MAKNNSTTYSSETASNPVLDYEALEAVARIYQDEKDKIVDDLVYSIWLEGAK